MNKKTMILLAITMTASSLRAETLPVQGAAINLYGIPDARVGQSDGDGYGMQINVPIEKFRLHGEYEEAEVTEDLDLTQIRAGLGYLSTGRYRTGVVAEYIEIELEDDLTKVKPDGYGLHARADLVFSPDLNTYGQIGYVHLEDGAAEFEGGEINLGIALFLQRNVAAFIDYRKTWLEDDDDNEFKVGELRIGFRFQI